MTDIDNGTCTNVFSFFFCSYAHNISKQYGKCDYLVVIFSSPEPMAHGELI